MTKSIVFELIIEMCVFFGTSDDSQISSDAAVEQLERIAAQLKRLPPTDLQEFIELANRLAIKEREISGENTRYDLLNSLGDYLGIERT